MCAAGAGEGGTPANHNKDTKGDFQWKLKRFIFLIVQGATPETDVYLVLREKVYLSFIHSSIIPVRVIRVFRWWASY